MMTAAEGEELLQLILSLPEPVGARLLELAKQVAHDARVQELSDRLQGLCNQVQPGDNPPELMAEICLLAEQLAGLA